MEANFDKYSGGLRHIREGHLHKLGQLTVENDNFNKLSIAKTDRKGDPLGGKANVYQYFRICPDSSYTFKNYFRTTDNEKRRTGENTATMRNHIRGKLTLEKPGNNPKLAALHACYQVVLEAVKSLEHPNKMHMREWLLLEQISRQLEKMKGEDVDIGEQIPLMLNWIDDLLASSQFHKINVGGNRAFQNQQRLDKADIGMVKTAHQPPNINPQAQPALDRTGFKGFNGLLLQLRETLIDMQVEIESAALHSQKEQDIININNAMQTVANEIANFKGGFNTADYRLPIGMIKGDNLQTTVAQFSKRFDNYKERATQLSDLQQAMRAVADGIQSLALLDGKNGKGELDKKIAIEKDLKTCLGKMETLAGEYLKPELSAFKPQCYDELATGKGKTKEFLCAAIQSFDKVSCAIGAKISQINPREYLAATGLNNDNWLGLQASWNQSFTLVNQRHVTSLKAMVCDFSEHVLDVLNKDGSSSIYPQLSTMRTLSGHVTDAMDIFAKNIKIKDKKQASNTLNTLYSVVEQKHNYEQFYTHETSRMNTLFKEYLKAHDFFSHISPSELSANMKEIKKQIIAERKNGKNL
jgi:hypothetical protein